MECTSDSALIESVPIAVFSHSYLRDRVQLTENDGSLLSLYIGEGPPEAKATVAPWASQCCGPSL